MTVPAVPHGVMFHHFHGGSHPRVQGSISAVELDAIITWLGPDRILPPDGWLEKLSAGTLGPRDVCLTFDDSLRCQFDVALPVLEARGLTAFWFVSSGVFQGEPALFEVHRRFRCTAFDSVEDFYRAFFARLEADAPGAYAASRLTSAEIDGLRAPSPFYSDNDIRFRVVRDRLLDAAAFERLMGAMIRSAGQTIDGLSEGLWMTDVHLARLTAAGHAVGLHSYSHPMRFDALSEEAQAAEYTRNFEHVRRVAGAAPAAMAHPVNRYNAATLRVLAALGIHCGFRATMSPPSGGCINPSALEMARADHTTLLGKATEASCARK